MKNRLTSRLTLALAACAALLLVLAAPSAVGADAAAEGTLTEASFPSATLNEAIAYNVYLPAGYESATDRYPVLYLLHGRGDSKSAWTQMKGALDALIASGEIQPTIAIMPDAPWSSRASYYVDSGYTGADPGRKVETAFTQDLIAHVDATYRTVANRTGRGVAGYSMGGYGALRYSLAHPDLFGASIVLSPAVYVPIPPSDSSTREFGAFGLGKSLFVDSVYKKLNYPALFPSFTATGLPLPMFIAVGDDEFKNPDPKDAIHDLDFEAHVLFNQAVRVPEPDRRAPRGRRRPRLGRLGADVRRGREVHLPVPQPGARDPDEGDVDRDGPGGARRRRRDRRGRQRLPGARGRRLRRRPAVRGRQGPRARQGLAHGHAALDPRARVGPARAGVRRRDRPGRQCRRHRLHERRLRRCPRRQHHRRRLRRQVRPERESHVAAAVRRRRPWPTAAMRSRPMRPETST